MQNTRGKAFLKTLLFSTSAMALSIGAANAGASINEHLSTNNPFVLGGEKEVVFDLGSMCGDCGTAGLSEINDGGDLGFRIMFGNGSSQVVAAMDGFTTGPTNNGTGPNNTAPYLRSMDFSVTAGPMFKIIGASLKAEAGVTAIYDYNANGENSFDGFSATAAASGDIDLGLTSGGFSVDVDTFFDRSIGPVMGLNSSSSAGNNNSEDMEMVMGSLPPAVSYDFSLDWDLSASAQCTHDGFGNSSSAQTIKPNCTANGSAFITAIEIRFKQVQVSEPASLAIFGLGLAGLGALTRRRRKA